MRGEGVEITIAALDCGGQNGQDGVNGPNLQFSIFNYQSSIFNFQSSIFNFQLPFKMRFITLFALLLLYSCHIHAQDKALLSQADSLDVLAKELSHAGKAAEAITIGQQALDIIKTQMGCDNATYAHMLSNLAGYYSRSGNYDEALRLGTEAMDIRKEVLGEKHLDYAHSLNNVAKYHSYLGNYFNAVRLGRKALETIEALNGKENADYAQALSNMAGYFSRMGNYDEALSMGEEACAIRERVLGRQHPDYAESLNNLAKYHYFLGEYDQAINLESQALALHEQNYGKHHPDYATALSNLADYYEQQGNFAEAMRRGSEAMEIRREVLGEKHPEYAESMANLAAYHHRLGNHAEAVKYGAQVLALRQEVLGEEHQAYAWSLCKMATYFSANEQADSAEVFAERATEKYTNFILSSFADMTANERNFFWMRMKSWFTKMVLQLAVKHPTEKMVTSAYNCTLLAKGLLLNSEIEMTNLLMESGDSTLVNAYQQLQANRALLIKTYETPKAQHTINTDSLQRVITRQERRLVQRSKTYGNYTKSLRIDWRQIARHLSYDDIAIEFVTYKNDADEVAYAALIVTPRLPHPTLVPLMSQGQLNDIPAKDIYTTHKLSSLVWAPLHEYLKRAKRVFFAPAGELYNIGIESLPHWQEEGYMADQWKLYRLSSTREIAIDRGNTRQRPSTADIFGGITYDHRKSQGDGTASTSKRQKEKAAKYLPGTRKEAEEIYQCLTEDNIQVNLHLGSQATEESMKNLSGHAPDILHIATHGFYWTDQEIREGNMDEKLQFLSMYGNLDDADQALTRSGLLFAGANYTLTGKQISDQYDDGILTAKEISVLDLRGVDMLVLSACQTGLGKVTGDGVFGLQRGFKKAGAGCLLMSLWKVDDKATRQLMTFFYHNLTQGMSKHDAFSKAQHDLRNMDVEDNSRHKNRRAISSKAKRAKNATTKKVYANPHYWAAFILLDAIPSSLAIR